METIKNKRLQKSKMLWIKWHWWWFRQLRDSVHMERRYWPAFIMTMRGANFFELWIGPLNIGWRMPWLRGPAEQYLNNHDGQIER